MHTVPRVVRFGMVAMVAAVACQALLATLGLDAGADIAGGLIVPLLAALIVAERVRRTRSERTAWSAVVVALCLLIAGNVYCVEITEESLMADRLRARSLIAGLRELGVAISIDDYGTGYSSLPYLRDLEVDSLKLDRSFVTGLADSGKAGTIVASTIKLAHALGLWVVAEGVESSDDWLALDALDCDAVQGYLLSRPVPTARSGRPTHRPPDAPASRPNGGGAGAGPPLSRESSRLPRPATPAAEVGAPFTRRQ